MSDIQRDHPDVEADRRTAILWVGGVVVFLSLVVIINIAVAVMANGVFPELVTENYYEEALAYEDVIHMRQRAEAVDLEVKVKDNGLWLQSATTLTELKNVRVRFYRPSEKSLDFETTAIIRSSGKLELSSVPNVAGRWDVTVVTTIHGEDALAQVRWFVAPQPTSAL